MSRRPPIPSVLVVIPARGGSKGIPRKNLRSLGGKPLIAYSISTAKQSAYVSDVVVSSDDDEILTVASKYGAATHLRSPDIADDLTTLDPVIYSAYEWARTAFGKDYSLIITMQPTSPLLSVESLDAAIQKLLENEQVDTVISARDDTHLAWRKQDGKFVPDYAKRVNRQELPARYRETGGLVATRSSVITPESRIGPKVDLLVLNQREAIDIDTYEDWSLCEYHLRRKRLLFVVSGYREIGLGHVYNTLLIANDILKHEVLFLVDDRSQMAYDRIADRNYPVYMQQSPNIVDDIRRLDPDLVINDRLSTTEEYMQALKNLAVPTINFEDEGPGARLADVVINAIYPEPSINTGRYYGHRYFCLRDEFLLTKPKTFRPTVERVLITFGGVDPNNYTHKVLSAISDYCQEADIEIDVVAGFGYNNYDSISGFPGNIHRDVGRISDFMAAADLVFTSAGRTVFEIAAVQTPAVVLAQNERELTHTFASAENGFLNLGLGHKVSNADLLQHFRQLVESAAVRRHMSELMSRINLSEGRRNVLKLIDQVLEQD